MITQKELKKLLHYDPETGDFVRLTNIGGASEGDIAGAMMNTGYVSISVKGYRLLAHRLAWLYMEGSFPEKHIDHINHIKNDNRYCNLRNVTHKQNMRNMKLSCSNTSGVTGVCWLEKQNKWLSQIKVDSKSINLGIHIDKFEAICARKSADNKYCFFENHGAAEC